MIIDSHVHVFPEAVVDRAMEFLSARYGAEPVARATVDELKLQMDAAGVDQSVVLGVATRPDQVPSINKWFISLQADPRLIPFGALHPHMDNVADEVQRLVDAGIQGVKLQPHFQEFDLDEPAAERMWEAIGDRLVTILHSGQEIVEIEDLRPTPTRIVQLLERHPELRLILAHLGGYRVWDDVEEELIGAPVHFDLSYTFDEAEDEQILRIIRAHGAERIIWASDFPWQSQQQSLAGLGRLPLAEDERRGILAGNLLALLKG